VVNHGQLGGNSRLVLTGLTAHSPVPALRKSMIPVLLSAVRTLAPGNRLVRNKSRLVAKGLPKRRPDWSSVRRY
jgi:hypothetical protein